MWWERGTFLTKYVKDGKTIRYRYDMQGHLVEREANGKTHKFYYDGDKLIAMEIGNEIIRFSYDVEGIAEFKIGTTKRYSYMKDPQGNVIGLLNENIIAFYHYDAWGNVRVEYGGGKEETSETNVMIFNPIRWKGQYCDPDSGLYWTGSRWYDPASRQYISASSMEMLLTNASIIYALNLYALCTTNPLAVIFAACTIMPSLDFYFDGKLTWWERWGKTVIFAIVGVVCTAIACIVSTPCGGVATAAGILSTLGHIATATIVGTAISLVVGGVIAGIQGALIGHGFWNSFAESVQNNFVDALVTSFAFAAATAALSNVIQHFQCFKEGTLVETEDGSKKIEDIQVGDKVLAYDEETGKQAYKSVVRLFRNETTEWYHIHANGEEIICTSEHPFYVAGLDKFIPARELKIGASLLLSDGTCAIIKEIQVEQLSKPETTYNFEVTDFHTYYVTESKVLVHNMCAKLDGAEEGLNFDSREKLNSHFEEHGGQFGDLYKTPDEYLDGANYVIRNGTKVEYMYKGEMTTGYVKFYGNSIKNGSAQFAVVGLQQNGNIATYHIKSAKQLWKMLGRTGII